MPISGPSSYVPTINAFATHWAAVNTELGGGGPLIVPGGATVAELTGYGDDLADFASQVEGQINDLEIARGTIELNKEPLLGRIGEFNRKVRGFLAQTPFARALPEIPAATAGEAKSLAALNDMAELWAKINAATIPGFTGPLTLLSGYAVAAFETAVAGLKTAYASYNTAEQNLTILRQQRNDVQDLAYAVLRDYRAAVIGSFAPDHALVESLPDLRATGGSTPDAVTLTGSWNETAGHATINWTASTDPALDYYSIRRSPGPTYSGDDEVVIDQVFPPTTMYTLDGSIVPPGATTLIRVYVVLTTGNERASNVLEIVRP